jgi:hypothetical protein
MRFDVIGRDRRVTGEEMYPPRVGAFSPGFRAVHQIAFSYNADNLADVVNDGNRTYAILEQDLCDVPYGRNLPYRNYGRNHHIARLHDHDSSDEQSGHIFGVLPGTELIHINRDDART